MGEMNAPPRRQRPLPLVTFTFLVPCTKSKSSRSTTTKLGASPSYSSPFSSSSTAHSSASFSKLSLSTTMSSTVSPVPPVPSTPSIPPHLSLPAPGVSLRTKFSVVKPNKPGSSDHGESKYLRPVPPMQAEDILIPKRGRNARKRMHQAEHFRHYLYLRRQLKPWSDTFREKYGRTPSLVDVHQASVPGLLDRFVEYLEALDKLRD